MGAECCFAATQAFAFGGRTCIVHLMKRIVMNSMKVIFSVLLAVTATNSFASDWNMVASSAEEQVFIDSRSINREDDGIVQVRILENFAKTNDMGQGVYEHKSRVMLVGVDCHLGALGYQQWSLQSGAIGTGDTVWADGMRDGPSYFRPHAGSAYERVVNTVCASSMASPQ